MVSNNIYKTFFCRPDSFYTMALYTDACVESQFTGVCGLKCLLYSIHTNNYDCM